MIGRRIEAVTGTLDLSDKADCRGSEFQDPGGFGWMRLEGGLMASVDAANQAVTRPQIVLHGSKGMAITGTQDVHLEYADGTSETWEEPHRDRTSMDQAVAEIVAALDGTASFPHSARESVEILEAITAFHLSHAVNAAWIELPLTTEQRSFEVRSA